MKWKAYIPLAVAIVLGLFAARIATSLVNSAPAITTPQIATTDSVVLARDIEPGTTLAETDLVHAKLASESLPTGALTSSQQLVGKVTKISLVRGQTITPNLLAEDGAGYGVGATLPEGMRAVTIDINDTTGVAGFILPKSRVDVIATLSVDGKSVAKTVLESVQVLAVGPRINPTAPAEQGNNGQAQPSRTVTLLVKPKDAEKVELAASMSRLRLVLRNGRDGTTADSDGVSVAQLNGTPTTGPSIPKSIDTVLPAGFRAVTVDISDTTGVAGFIQPKSKVDLVTTFQNGEKTTARTLLQNVTVIAVGSRTDAGTPVDPSQPTSRTVTLLVKPKDAEKVELASATGKVRLVLRNGEDAIEDDSDGVTLAELKGRRTADTDPFADATHTVAATQPSNTLKPATLSWTVTTIKAGVPSQQTFDVPVTIPTEQTPDYSKVTHLDNK